jgi:CheY-like chemotaxis protein
MEQELIRAQKMESVSLLAGGIAHDFNNILTAILGNIGLAMLNGQVGDRGRAKLLQAEQACIRAKDLAQQLLTFAKGGAPITRPISIAGLLQESAVLTLAGSRSRCNLSLPPDLWAVTADDGQINQVISNLLINADQAMPGGGIIKVAAENVLVNGTPDLPLPRGRYVKISIADQGTGIPPQYLNKVFDPYFSTKHKGSGLGLATAYSIVKNHAGYLTLDSKMGEGATFHVFLPGSEMDPLPPEPVKPIPARGQGRVLAMDDEAMVRSVLVEMLTYLGYEVECAGDGSQAVEKYLQARAAGRPFDAVILDLTVPGAMGGRDAIQEMLRHDPRVKAVVSSGYSDDPIMADFQQYGFTAVIVKPYRVLELSNVLKQVII